jgi:hypothetical protein
MGACSFHRVAYGKDAAEAYNDAHLEAQSERGPQGGYSGDLNSKSGYLLVEVPIGIKFSVWLRALDDEELPIEYYRHTEEFVRQCEIYNNKWGPALCFEVLAANRQGPDRKYIFVGLAPE